MSLFVEAPSLSLPSRHFSPKVLGLVVSAEKKKPVFITHRLDANYILGHIRKQILAHVIISAWNPRWLIATIVSFCAFTNHKTSGD